MGLLLKELAALLSLETVVAGNPEALIEQGYTSDLLSDVMAHAKDNSVLITIQSHKNSVAVAAMLDMPAIIICNRRPVPADMKTAAESEHIGILLTDDDQYTVSWKLRDALRG